MSSNTPDIDAVIGPSASASASVVHGAPLLLDVEEQIDLVQQRIDCVNMELVLPVEATIAALEQRLRPLKRKHQHALVCVERRCKRICVAHERLLRLQQLQQHISKAHVTKKPVYFLTCNSSTHLKLSSLLQTLPDVSSHLATLVPHGSSMACVGDSRDYDDGWELRRAEVKGIPQHFPSSDAEDYIMLEGSLQDELDELAGDMTIDNIDHKSRHGEAHGETSCRIFRWCSADQNTSRLHHAGATTVEEDSDDEDDEAEGDDDDVIGDANGEDDAVVDGAYGAESVVETGVSNAVHMRASAWFQLQIAETVSTATALPPSDDDLLKEDGQ